MVQAGRLHTLQASMPSQTWVGGWDGESVNVNVYIKSCDAIQLTIDHVCTGVVDK